MATAQGSQEKSAFKSCQNRIDMLRALKVIGDMLERRRVPLSVRGARGLGFLITLAIGALSDDDQPSKTVDDPE
ncbi:MAG TPA: hypothetical protein VMU36_03145 [Spirochaetia bacterium]|nr:hypothetical protein [Spirochaetia bacterium]